MTSKPIGVDMLLKRCDDVQIDVVDMLQGG
jgi:hypothetical protein